MLTRIMFLVPVFVMLLMLIQLLVSKIGENKVVVTGGKSVYFFKPDTLPGKIKDSFVLWYKTRLLDYSPNFTFSRTIKIKLVFMVLAMVLITAVQLTNIQIYGKDIQRVFDYRSDVISERVHIEDIAKELDNEVRLMNAAITNLSKQDIINKPKEYILGDLRYYIVDRELEFDQPEEVVVDKVYNRLIDYFGTQKFSVFMLLFFGLAAFMLPDWYLWFRKVFVKASRKRELRFLKRLVVLNGSIKPVDFISLLRTMMSHSIYHRSMLREIYDANQKNKIDTRKIYRKYINAEKDLDVKLFYEKLDQANNHDFEQAIRNIADDFAVERRQRLRETRKRVELIHTISVAGIIAIIAVLVVYLLLPWMQAYNINELIKMQ